MNRLKYDVRKRAKASTHATFRGVVSLYLIYLGASILQSTRRGETTMPRLLGYGIGIFFILVALGFGLISLRRYRSDLADARLPEAPSEEPTPSNNTEK